MEIKYCNFELSNQPENYIDNRCVLEPHELCIEEVTPTSNSSEITGHSLKRNFSESSKTSEYSIVTNNNTTFKTQISNFSQRLEMIESLLSDKIVRNQHNLVENLNKHLMRFSNKNLSNNISSYLDSHESHNYENKFFKLAPIPNLANNFNIPPPDINKFDKLYIKWANEAMIQELIALYFSVVQVSHPLVNKHAFETKKGCCSKALIYAMCAYSVKFSSNENWIKTPRWLLSQSFFNASRNAISEAQYSPSQANMQALNMLGTLCFEMDTLSMNLIASSIKMGQQLGYVYLVSCENLDTTYLQEDLEDYKERCRAWMFCLEMERVSSLIHQRPLIQKFKPGDGGIHIINLTIPINIEDSTQGKDQLLSNNILQQEVVENYVKIIHHFFFCLRLLTQYIIQEDIKEKNKSKETTDLLNYTQKLTFTFSKLNALLPSPKLRLMMRNFTLYVRNLLGAVTIIYYFPEILNTQVKKLSLTTSNSRIGKRILNRCITCVEQAHIAAKVVKDRRTNQRSSASVSFDFYVFACFLIKLKNSEFKTQVKYSEEMVTDFISAINHLSSYWSFARVCLQNLQLIQD
ncbi:hypothetical protein K502DRAFT_322968 [Neoconidiobolus thromboides FSU 785]|nr:hypothetical protein K502DRAFT_322968 [Neoconidiobolus thromboides FSU 785]